MAAQRVQPVIGRMAVSIEVFPPDRRKRDVDNLLKSLVDALQHAGVFPDDSQIIWLLVYRAAVIRGGRVVVTIRDLAADQLPPTDAQIWSPSLN